MRVEGEELVSLQGVVEELVSLLGVGEVEFPQVEVEEGFPQVEAVVAKVYQLVAEEEAQPCPFLYPFLFLYPQVPPVGVEVQCLVVEVEVAFRQEVVVGRQQVGSLREEAVAPAMGSQQEEAAGRLDVLLSHCEHKQQDFQ